MKKICLIAALLFMTAMCLGTVANASTTLDFAAVTGASIAFDGSGGFSFTPSANGEYSGYDFQVTSGSTSYLGTIGGTYAIGTVTSNGGLDTAPVTGSGTFTINDGNGGALTGTVNWENVDTLGATGGLNYTSTANLTGVSYTGTDSYLEQFATGFPDILTLTFQFSNPTPLSTLKTSSISTSYSGSLSTVPIPGALLLLGGGLIRLMGYGRRRKALV